MSDFVPFGIALIALLVTIKCVSKLPLVQVYLAVVFCYLNLFPLISNVLTVFPSENFSKAQYIAVFLFEIPLFSLLAFNGWRQRNRSVGRHPSSISLSPIAPWALSVLLAIFYFVALAYDQFFVRLGYDAFLHNPDSVPKLLLYPYRLAVDGSFFVILYLVFCLQFSAPDAKYRASHKFVLVLYLTTFLVFFLINSRMQFLLLLLCLYFVRPGFKSPKINIKKLSYLSIGAVSLVVFLTLIREYLIESNDRLVAGELGGFFYLVSLLIADRLNSLVMLTRALDVGYSPFNPELSGLIHLWNLYFSFFADPATYSEIRSSEITSPSVAIINKILSEGHVDFPKSMMLDVQLIFGSLALPLLAWLLASLIIFCQTSIKNAAKVNARLILSLFLAPLLLQFEKETFGFISFALKWSPLLLLLIFLHKLKVGKISKSSDQIASPGL